MLCRWINTVLAASTTVPIFALWAVKKAKEKTRHRVRMKMSPLVFISSRIACQAKISDHLTVAKAAARRFLKRKMPVNAAVYSAINVAQATPCTPSSRTGTNRRSRPILVRFSTICNTNASRVLCRPMKIPVKT